MSKNRKLQGTVLKKLLLIPIVLMVPVNILLIIVSGIQFKSSKQQALKAMEIGFSQVAARIQMKTESVNRYMQLRLGNSAPFLRQAERGKVDMDDSNGFRDMLTVISDMEEFRDENNSLSLVFLKFSYMEEYMIRGVEAERSRPLLKATDTESMKNGEWRCIPLKDELAVITLWKTEGAVLGYRMELYDELYPLLRDYTLASRCALQPIGETPDASPAELILTEELPGLKTMILLGIRRMDYNAQVPLAAWLILMLSLAAMGISPILTVYYYRSIVKPVAELHRTMQEIRDGNAYYRAQVKGDPKKNEFVELADYFNAMIDELQLAKLEMYEKSLEEKNIRLRFYAQQIQPHFLLNALNRIYTHEAEDWPEVKREILMLARYFRTVVNVSHEFVPLVAEMDFVKRYLEIQKLLYNKGELFTVVSWAQDLAMLKVPPMILGSFLGNCIKHGLAMEGTSCLAVSAELEKDKALIRISDNGSGFPEKVLREFERLIQEPGDSELLGVGVPNSLQRLRLLYEGRASIRFYNDGGAVTELRLPLEYMEEPA